MDIKPSIFIGSSCEGYSIAQKMAKLLEDISTPVLWKSVFDYNTSSFDNLISKIALYDYAILIATADDVVISRKKKKSISRDNVLFEFGIFAGGLGRSRAFYAVEEETKIPSDLSGISLPYLSKPTAPDFDVKLLDFVSKIKNHIKQKENTFDLGFLPSTTLAFGYFSNFVERTVERLLEDKKTGKEFVFENGRSFKIDAIQFTILIPNDLGDDMFNKVKAKRLRDNWQKLKVEPKDVRDYDFSVDVTRAEDGLLHLIDIPFTLNALSKSIDLYAGIEHIGKNEKETLLEQRELRNFRRTLEYLIKRSSFTKGLVKTEIVDI